MEQCGTPYILLRVRHAFSTTLADFSTFRLVIYVYARIHTFFMFIYVRAKEMVMCPGYEAVVSFVRGDAAKLKLGESTVKQRMLQY